MSTIAHKTHHLASDSFSIIIMLSAWGFTMVLTSFLFLWLGYLLDKLLGTTPKFMLGMFCLSIIGCFILIYQSAMKIVSHKGQK